jgi:hypothetical protein
VSEKEFVGINLVIQRYEVLYYHLWNQSLPYMDPMGCLEIINDNQIILPVLVILTETFLELRIYKSITLLLMEWK